MADIVEDCCTQLRRRTLEGSLPCAKRTAEILRRVITQHKYTDAAAAVEDIRRCGSRLQAAKPSELAIGNIVRRVLHIIREEQQSDDEPEVQHDPLPSSSPARQQAASSSLLSQALGRHTRNISRVISLSNLLDQGVDDSSSLHAASDELEDHEAVASRRAGRAKHQATWKHKHQVIELINELIEELDGIEAQIAQQAVEHIHANEVILTFGMSDTTCHFLQEASKKREFQVVVSEGAPRYDGHQMAAQLATAGVQTTVIADSAVFAMMARANKVLVGAHAVLANGGVVAPSGIHMVALAAKRHSIPLVVLVGLHKLSPHFPHDPDVALNEFKSPAAAADFDVVAESFAVQDEAQQDLAVAVHNPAFDYIPPHLVSLFVTDTGGYTPSYVYRLLAEYYSREDYVLSREADS